MPDKEIYGFRYIISLIIIKVYDYAKNNKILFQIILVIILLLAVAKTENKIRLDIAAIEKPTGHNGTYDEKENVFKVSLPRAIFLHFRGIGKTTDLAKRLKAAIDTQKYSADISMKAM